MPHPGFVPRRATSAIADALADTRVVLVNGARQAGKSTLVRAVAGQRAAEWRDLDLPQDRQSALEDPVGFVSFDGLTVIDEIQRAPELLLAIKATVNADPSPGRFLLTGSSRLLGLRDLPDTLPGRMETIELWPFSQGEIDRSADSFIDTAFHLGPDMRHESAVTRADYADRLVRGGLPEAVARIDPRRRGKFLDAYVQNLIDRDVRQLTEIERAPQLSALIRLLAARSGLLVAAGSLESESADLAAHRRPLHAPAGRGIPRQAHTRLVAESRHSRDSGTEAHLRRLGDRRPPASRSTRTRCAGLALRSAPCSRASSCPNWPGS